MGDRKVHLRYPNGRIACGRANHYGMAGGGGAAFSITAAELREGTLGGKITCVSCLKVHPTINNKSEV